MLFCRHVAKALAENNYWDLPLHKRIGLRFHVALCFVCGRYNSQILLLQEMTRAFLDREEEIMEQGHIKLSEESRKRIKELIEKEL